MRMQAGWHGNKENIKETGEQGDNNNSDTGAEQNNGFPRDNSQWAYIITVPSAGKGIQNFCFLSFSHSLKSRIPSVLKP